MVGRDVPTGINGVGVADALGSDVTISCEIAWDDGPFDVPLTGKLHAREIMAIRAKNANNFFIR